MGEENLFLEIPDHLGGSLEPWWMLRGGHRLWIAPEVRPDTYALDNVPVQVSRGDSSISLLQSVEAETLLQKQITISWESPSEIHVSHKVENRGDSPRKLAPWALTAFAPGGVAITLLTKRSSDSDPLQPTSSLAMWSYTNFSDPRWTFLSRYLLLRQDPQIHSPQKVGLFNDHSVSCYLLGTVLFVKRSQSYPGALYPDFHSSVELFANADFLELETLGPLVELQPGSSVEHVERWSLFRNVQISDFTEAELDRTLLPILQHLT